MANRQQQLRLFTEVRLHPWKPDQVPTILHNLSDPGLNGTPEAGDHLRNKYIKKAEKYKHKFDSPDAYKDFMERIGAHQLPDLEPKPQESLEQTEAQKAMHGEAVTQDSQGAGEFNSPEEYEAFLSDLKMDELKPIAAKYGADMARSKAETVKNIMEKAVGTQEAPSDDDSEAKLDEEKKEGTKVEVEEEKTEEEGEGSTSTTQE